MQLPLPFPDEIIFSRINRHLTLSGMPKESYLSIVFGNHKAIIHPFLTAGLERLCKLTQESPSEILMKQTLAPLFMHFLPCYKSTISSTLISCKASKAIRACQLICVREKEPLSIKFCPECARANVQEFGIPYWHRCHQIPGIGSCSIHRVQLINFPLESRSRLNYNFFPPLNIQSKVCNQISFEFAQYAYGVLAKISHGNKHFDLNTVKKKLQRLGYVTKKGNYRRKLILKSLFQLSEGLVHDTRALLPRSVKDYRYISYLLSGKVTQHPIKFLLLGFWLSKQTVYKKRNDEVSIAPKKIEQIEKQCIALLEKGKSMASISRITGKSRCYIKALALRLNIRINLKPRYITESIKQEVLNLAKRGFHRKAIATLFKISSGSVEQIISSEPSIVANRKLFKYESKRRKYKAIILRFIKYHPSAIRQKIKNNCYAAFHWLYVNEKAWLESIQPPPSKLKPKPKIDWKKRDRILAMKVRITVNSAKSAISRSQLDEKLGGHGWLIRYQHKLPETMAEYYKK